MPRVLVPLAAGCEEIEAVTAIDLLRRAGITVVTAGLEPGPVTASRGVVLVPEVQLSDLDEDDDFDMILLPGGGPGAKALRGNARVLSRVRSFHRQGRWVAAICAAPQVLASAGILEGRRATSFPGILEAENLATTRLTGAPVEVDGKIITSRGPGTAMDFALECIRALLGDEARREVEAPLQRP
jgi:4-methyl-5(b-hydroxyethyl)-thiazole monophosphate biosynthesis